MLILLEGLDGAGKTSLAQSLRDKLAALDRDVRVFEHPARWDVIDYPHALVTHVTYNALRYADWSRDLIVDRLWVTDRVYERVLGRPRYDRSYIDVTRDFGDTLVVVYVRASPGVCLGRLRGREEPMLRYLPDLYAEFERYFESVPEGERCFVVRAETEASSDVSGDVLREILEWESRWQRVS